MRRDPPKRPRPLNNPLGFVLVAFCICARSSGQDDAFFENRVRPVLAENCFKCHGGKSSKGGVRLDRREALVHKDKKGPIIVPGKPGQGRLLAAVRHTGEIKMPPKKKLAPGQTLHIDCAFDGGSGQEGFKVIGTSQEIDLLFLETNGQERSAAQPEATLNSPFGQLMGSVMTGTRASRPSIKEPSEYVAKEILWVKLK